MAVESGASGPVKAAGTALDPSMTASSAFTAIVRDALQHLQVNEDGFLTRDDPEYLHQLRVALRRTRSAFSAFSAVLPERAPASVVAHLEWLGKALGPARDWDVFVTETLPPITKAFEDVAGLHSFADACASPRGRARQRARRAMATQRYQRLRGTLAAVAEQGWRERAQPPALAALDAPVCAYAEAELQRCYDRVRKRGKKIAQQSAAEHHRLRVAVKKLRYAVDFFASLFEKDRVRPWRAHLSRLQDILGAMNDATAVRHRVESMLGTAQTPTAAEARGILLGWSEGQARMLESELRREWKAYRKIERFW